MNPPVVYVPIHRVDIGSPIPASMASCGNCVAWLSDAAEPATVDVGAAVARVAAGFGSRAELERAFAAAYARRLRED
jgi:hypothetical protein